MLSKKIKISAEPASTVTNKTGGWRTFKPEIDINRCIGCANCTRVCPEGIMKMVEMAGKKKAKVDYDFCKGCGICAAECPVRCIEMKLEYN